MAYKPKKRPPSDRGLIVTPQDKPIPWMATPGMYIAGREALDDADQLEIELERKWGRDRLRMLVDATLREKFDRQRYLLKQARWTGQLEDVKREAGRMVKALNALDKVATEAGKKPLAPTVWEVTIPSGILSNAVVAIVKEPEAAYLVEPDGRNVVVYTLDEIANLIAADFCSLQVKLTFPGAEVVQTKTRVIDPLTPVLLHDDEGILDVSAPIDGIKDFDEGGDSVPF